MQGVGMMVLLVAGGVLAATENVLVKVPPGSTLIGQAEVDEIRAFPEMSGEGEAKKRAQSAKLVGVKALDRVYSSDKSYQEVIPIA